MYMSEPLILMNQSANVAFPTNLCLGNVSCIGIMGKTRLRSFLSLSIEMTEWSVHIINFKLC